MRNPRNTAYYTKEKTERSMRARFPNTTPDELSVQYALYVSSLTGIVWPNSFRLCARIILHLCAFSAFITQPGQKSRVKK